MGNNYPQSIWYEQETDSGEESDYLGNLAKDESSEGWTQDYEFDEDT